MKQVFAGVLVLCMVALAGCKYFEPKQDLTRPQHRRAANEEMVNVALDEQVRNAVIRQRTVFPHHFVAGTAELNALGKRDLEILAGHYGDYPGGPLGVRAEGACCDLDDARVAAVKCFLEREGVDVAAMTIGDAYPAGDGMSGTRVLRAVTPKEESESSEESEGPGGLADLLGGGK